MDAIEAKLRDMGYAIPDLTPPVGNYVGAVRTGNLVFVSGHGPFRDGDWHYIGKLGRDMDVDTAREAALLVALNLLASLKAEIGTLDRVKRIVRLFGMVNSAPDFAAQPKVIDGASDLLVELFGDRGLHSRSAIGMGALPFGISVEIEMVVEVDPDEPVT
jgi:enamine deaminase RidA (YjgF/YER057c/UK114 family)